MVKLSVYMITLNEEKRLERTLQAVAKIADEIIIVDSGSLDKTKDIAEKFGAKFYYNDWVSYAHQKSYAESLCSYDWRLSLDADEVLSVDLITEIRKELENPQFDVYKIKIGEMFPNFKAPRKGTKMYNLERLYHKNFAYMPKHNLTKDRLVVKKDAKIGQFKNLIYHYSYLTLSHQINKLNRYTDQVLQTAISEQKQYGVFRLATEFFRQFICYYFIKRNFLNGQWGFVFSVNLAYFRFLKLAKWFEYNNIHEKQRTVFKKTLKIPF